MCAMTPPNFGYSLSKRGQVKQYKAGSDICFEEYCILYGRSPILSSSDDMSNEIYAKVSALVVSPRHLLEGIVSHKKVMLYIENGRGC